MRATRINVVGTAGSGKTTFSRALARTLGLPHVEIDALYWGPGWQAASYARLVDDIRHRTRQPGWVLDGNYSATNAVKWDTVQQIVWLDLPLPVTLFQLIRRTVGRVFTREELWPGTGNTESLRSCFFSRDSIILWCLRSHARNRRRYGALMVDPDYARVEFIRLRSRREAERYLARLAARQAIVSGQGRS